MNSIPAATPTTAAIPSAMAAPVRSPVSAGAEAGDALAIGSLSAIATAGTDGVGSLAMATDVGLEAGDAGVEGIGVGDRPGVPGWGFTYGASAVELGTWAASCAPEGSSAGQTLSNPTVPGKVLPENDALVPDDPTSVPAICSQLVTTLWWPAVQPSFA